MYVSSEAGKVGVTQVNTSAAKVPDVKTGVISLGVCLLDFGLILPCYTLIILF